MTPSFRPTGAGGFFLPEAAARGHLESSSLRLDPFAGGEKRRDLVGALDKRSDIFLTNRLAHATVFQNAATRLDGLRPD